ncbi:unnamed protein product [Symbiodinium sp. CCMP2592]|nr:unnamed protein product [Symbiodinium sp. CCMP2592]
MWQIKAVAQCLLAPVLAWMLLALQGCELAQVQKAAADAKQKVESLLPGSNRSREETRTRAQAAFLQPSRPSSSQAAEMPVELSIPLAASFWSLGARLLMPVSPKSSNGGLLPAQMLMVDTGSSSLAFCESSLLQEAAYQETQYNSCNRYNPGGAPMYYWGPFVEGDLHAGNVTFSNASYSIMGQEENMGCQHGIQGIFGIAFRQLDVASPTKPNFTMADCQEDGEELPPPMIQTLQAQGGVEKLGIHWSGQLGDNRGRLYLDDAAVTNEHYDKTSEVGPAVLGETGWYDIAVQKISVGDQEFTGLGCAPEPGKQCVMDTGTPAVTVPPEVFDSAAQLIKAGGSANLTFWLPAVSGDAVALSFDLATIFQMGGLFKGRKEENVILGLSMWAFYYTVFDISAQSVSFFPQQPGTEASRSAILQKILAEERALGLLPPGEGRRMEELPVTVHV